MKIKSLELAGFKSFYERTKIHFHDNISAVVGPNGCGKSNILDAVKWVLGEQNSRNLRAEGMENVIANGSDKLKSLGMAEVSLLLEDVPGSGFDEVVIKRRLYRSGESEYSINGVKCRLKDITEMFLDTGVGARAYSIVGQGSVESFITAKPEEKRKLIEEVAGIVKYKTRRKETCSRIESTRDNLQRVQDMKNEVSKQMETLSKQAQQAESYRELTDKGRQLENLVLLTKLENGENKKESLLEEKKQTEQRIEQLKTAADEKTRVLNEIELSNSELEMDVEQSEKEIYELKSQLQEKNSFQNFAEKETQASEQYISRLENEIESLNQELERLESSNAEKTQEIEKIKSSKTSFSSDISEKEKALELLKEVSSKSKEALSGTNREKYEILNRESSLKSTKYSLIKDIEELGQRLETINTQLTSLNENREKVEKELNQYKSEQGKIRDEFERKREEKKSLDSLLYDQRIEHEKKTGEISNLESRISECNSEIKILKQIQANYEWLPEITRDFVLKQKGNGVLGVISDFIYAPKDYEKAVEAAFGEKLNWIVVQENKDATYAVESLRESSVGRGTFIPVKDRISRKGHGSNGYNVRQINELIDISGIDDELIESILSDVFVASDLKEALSIKTSMGNGACFATLQGDYVDSTGAITGGFSSGGVFERKREIEELTNEVKELNARLENTRKEASGLKQEIKANEEKSALIDDALKNYEIKSVENIKDQSNLENRIENLQRQLDGLNEEKSGINLKTEEKRSSMDEIDCLLEEIETTKERLDKQYSGLEKDVQQFDEKENQLEEEITRLKIESASVLEKERSLDYELREIENRKSRIEEKISIESKEIEIKKEEKQNLEESRGKSVGEIESLNQKLSEKENRLRDLKENRVFSKSSVEDNKKTLSELNQKISAENPNLNSIEIKLNSISIELQHLNEQLESLREEHGEDHGITDTFFEPGQEFDLNEAEKELKSIKRSIDRFGPVNLLAPEEYKNLEERHTFLTEQTDDLEKAMDSLLKAINKLDRESVAKFKEAFEIINSKFSEIFSRLFEGGEGKLIITNPEDILQTGIDVMVKPRGKKFQSISLLSGGEKALSAIALIVSACFVKPVPFLLFDEIDAPLDEQNTVRFSRLLKEISSESQVVIITHNKRTMQDVDTLIGITSDRSVTSRVVSVELN